MGDILTFLWAGKINPSQIVVFCLPILWPQTGTLLDFLVVQIRQRNIFEPNTQWDWCIYLYIWVV